MSERTNRRSFFNLRYALPGYTFILLILLINLRELLYFLLKFVPRLGHSEIVLSLLGILFGFLTLMSGSAVGFLVSQCWYTVYHILNYVGLKSGITKRFGSYRVLIEEFGVEDNIRSLETELNNTVHSSETGIHTYFNRRWDLLMLFGSTLAAIVLSYMWSPVRDYIISQNAIPASQLTYIIWPNYYLVLFWGRIALAACLIVGYIFVWLQHDSMCTYVIRKNQSQKSRSADKEESPKDRNEKESIRENREESARLILENNRDTLIFWGVLTFTCTVGIIELLQAVNETFPSLEQICVGIIYFTLLFGMVYSIYRALEIYRDNRKLSLSGRLGTEIREKAEGERTHIDRFVDWKWGKPAEGLTIAGGFIVFFILYLAKIGVL